MRWFDKIPKEGDTKSKLKYAWYPTRIPLEKVTVWLEYYVEIKTFNKGTYSPSAPIVWITHTETIKKL